MRLSRVGMLAAALAGFCAPALAQDAAAPVQSAADALREDAAQYAARYGVSVDEAVLRLRAQEESVSETDAIRAQYEERIAGIAIEHQPAFRIVVLLTGSDPVPPRTISVGGMEVPIVFRTGARASRAKIVTAIAQHQATLRARLPHPPGLGLDERTGELVLLVMSSDAARVGTSNLKDEAEALTGVPVRVGLMDKPGANLAAEGGSRIEGRDATDGRRHYCTTGFVVTNGDKAGVVTAAHCPDTVTYYDPAGAKAELSFAGQWGWSYQDVQVNLTGEAAPRPFFYADTAKSVLRPLTGSRARASTRAGEAVCHRGESSGYTCAEIALTDFAPPGDLCGGPCAATWVTVGGPGCRGGDSGGPVFAGTVALGIVKGANYDRAGQCNFYYYMSTDYLPPGWSLLRAGAGDAPASPREGESDAPS
jgi:streptogrisin C